VTLLLSKRVIDVRYINLDHRQDRRRSIERQLHRQGIPGLRVPALAVEEGRASLPHAKVLDGEVGLLATWSALLEQVQHEGTRDGAQWLLVLEDDALLVPRFRKRVEAALNDVPPGCSVVQLAALTRYTIVRERVLWKTLVLCAIWLIRGEWTARARRRGGGPDPRFSTEVKMGAHAVAVRASAASDVAKIITAADVPLDVAFADTAQRDRGSVLRYRRQLAFQNPFAGSDIEPDRRERRGHGALDVRYIAQASRPDRRRRIELQLRLQRLDARRVEAVDPNDAVTILPDCTAPPSEAGRLASWYTIFQEVLDNGPRNRARWLVILEDDVLLVPFFRIRAVAALRTAPRGCILVQLGALEQSTSWRQDGVRRNVTRVATYLRDGGWRSSSRRSGDGDDSPFTTDLRRGSHATAVKVKAIPTLLGRMEPWDEALDVVLLRQAQEHPGLILRHRRQLAFRLPSESDPHALEAQPAPSNLRSTITDTST
jgi:GR25 family glycosyltransferase involved in LPS biosynthesis